MAVAWWMKLKPWQRTSLLVVGAIVVLYLAYMMFARYDNGTSVNVTINLGTNPDGTMYFRCVAAQSSAGVCGGNANQSTVNVHARDRLHVTVESLDGGKRAHDLKLAGFAYAAPYPWVETELQDAKESFAFTAWKAGSFKWWCEVSGHEAKGMHGMLVVA